MFNTPKDASDTFIDRLFDLLKEVTHEHAEQLKADPTLAARLDADPELQSVHADKLLEKAKEIDLRERDLDVRYDYHGTFRGKQQWTAWDAKTYDGTNEIGHGESKEDALVDLLDQLDEPEQPKPRKYRTIHTDHFEPNDTSKYPEPDLSDE